MPLIAPLLIEHSPGFAAKFLALWQLLLRLGATAGLA